MVSPKLKTLSDMVGLDNTFTWQVGEQVIPEQAEKIALLGTEHRSAVTNADNTLRDVQMLLQALQKTDVAAMTILCWRLCCLRLAAASLKMSMAGCFVDSGTKNMQEVIHTAMHELSSMMGDPEDEVRKAGE